ncbi:hypothetical protein HID58_018611 [Brassica napus]|uniref:Uncharacterized protein n=1 Tax=Brassica napus TaxID=3708 RepID=A0ABQ8DAH3_BRANA|nr:hypothetical protein HID58_018611 [Brassica napus]
MSKPSNLSTLLP